VISSLERHGGLLWFLIFIWRDGAAEPYACDFVVFVSLCGDGGGEGAGEPQIFHTTPRLPRATHNEIGLFCGPLTLLLTDLGTPTPRIVFFPVSDSL